jgi:DNA repair photolyase
VNNPNQKVLTLNKNRIKFFGVDYFANFYDGSQSTFKFFASSIDELMIYHDEMVSFNQYKYELFKMEIRNIEEKSIIGLFQNPDVYRDLESIDFILEDLKNSGLGLFLETNSEKILNDIEILKEFQKTNPLLIAIPINSNKSINVSFFEKQANLEAMSKVIHKLTDSNLNVGLIFKPLIPRLNDDVEELKKIIDKADGLNVNFIYPSFTLYFDSYKLKNFYDIIEIERPELRNFYFDKYGQKLSWESQNLNELKKMLVFNSKKSKIKYAMKDIISLYRDDTYTQLKLF